MRLDCWAPASIARCAWWCAPLVVIAQGLLDAIPPLDTRARERVNRIARVAGYTALIAFTAVFIYAIVRGLDALMRAL